jgi:hypothetical protein
MWNAFNFYFLYPPLFFCCFNFKEIERERVRGRGERDIEI